MAITIGVSACQTERTAEVRPIETPVAAPVTPAPAPSVVSGPSMPTVHTTAVEPIRTVGESRTYEELGDAMGEGIDTPAQRERLEGSQYVASVGQGRRFFVLAFSPKARENVARDRTPSAQYQPPGDYVVGDLWLHELRGDPEQAADVASAQLYQRVRGVCLAENVAESNQVCTYDPTSDAWQCPSPPMGQILFTPPSARTSFR